MPTLFNGNGHFYEYVPFTGGQRLTWEQAKDAAALRTNQGQSGYLVTITDAAESTFVTSVLGNNIAWIGASDAETEGTWKWVTGEPFTYTNWNTTTSTEPNGDTRENYGLAIGGSPFGEWSGRWADAPLDFEISQGYIVEYNAPTPQTTSLAIAATNANQAEGNSGSTPFTFTVTRSGSTTGATSVNWAVTGSGANQANATDFVGGLASGTVDFLAGETSKVITVNVQGDTTVEPDETFTVTLSSPTNGATLTTASATGTITNDDTTPQGTNLAIAATSANQTEGDFGSKPFTFTVTRSGITTGATSVNWAVTGSGANPANASDFVGGLAGTVDFAAGETSKVITVNVQGDTIVEPNETFAVTLSNPTNGAILTTASATGTIANDDALTGTTNTDGYFNFVQFTRGTGSTGAPIPFTPVEVGGLQIPLLFDETYYTWKNSDVKAAIQAGQFKSGYEHFVKFGQFEGRNPSTLYNEQYYLSTNTDVAQAVQRGEFKSGLQHFLLYGNKEERNPSALFNQQDYLTGNSDVQTAVAFGAFTSALDHYIEYGAAEGRVPDLILFQEKYYLDQNPDVKAAVQNGSLANGYEHYLKFGAREGRNPSSLFSESAYRELNSDVASAIDSGSVINGFAHYILFGREEGRAT